VIKYRPYAEKKKAKNSSNFTLTNTK